MSFEEAKVVFDIGSQSAKAGFAGESFPRCVMQTVVGRFRHKGIVDEVKLIYVGEEAVRNRGILNLNYPVQDGRITDWDEMEMLWHNLFYTQLQVPPESTYVVHAVHPLATIKEKQKITEILFEVFAIKALIIAKAPILSLYASGRTTGMIWGCGHSCCYACPVFEGFPLQHATLMSELTGSAVTEYMNTLLTQVGYQLTTPFEQVIVEKIKSTMCYVSHDYASEYETLLKKDKVNYQLPDGQHINLGTEQIQAPEIFFQPSLAGKSCPNIPDMIYNSIEKCDVDYRPMFFNNIVVSGGSTMFPSLTDRLRADVQVKVKNWPGYNTKVYGIPNRSLSVWAGGSMIACMDTVNRFWLTSKEYDDSGDESVIYKFY